MCFGQAVWMIIAIVGSFGAVAIVLWLIGKVLGV